MQKIRTYLFENESVKGIQKPTDYTYFKKIRIILLTLNSWPGKEIDENISNRWKLITFGFMIMYPFYIIGGIMFLRSRTLSFYELGHMYTTQFMSIVAASRVFLISLSSRYKEVFKIFLTQMHLFYYKHKSDYAMQTHKRVHLFSHLLTMFTLFQMFSGILLFNFIPMYKNYAVGNYREKNLQNATYEHSVYYSFPLDITTTFNGYICACLLNWIESYFTGTWFCIIDLFLSLIVFHIWGHFKILIHDLGSFPLPAKNNIKTVANKNANINAEMYNEDELKEVARKLKDCIIYHRVIVKFTNKVSDTFGPLLFVYYIYHQVSLCLMLLECSQMTLEALMRYGPVTVILFQQLIQTSVIFELIGTMSEMLKDAVYGIPWEYMDVKNRRTVGIFLINVQEPIYVKALGIAQVGVTSMATIIKTSFSYFAFLRTSSQ